MQRCEEAKSFTEITESILAPMEGERICGRTECNESVKRADVANCDRVTIAELWERKANPRQEAIVHERLVSVTSAGAGGNHIATIQSNPSPEFLNSLPFIKKFYPLPAGARERFTKVTRENSCNLRHSEALQSRKNPAYLLYNTSKLKGIHMNNLTETDHASTPLGIFASELVSIKTKNQIAYPSKSSLTREDLCYSEVVHDDHFNSTETVHSPLTTHNSLKKVAFTLAEVLITLGIIGVVAALTLPTVIQNYQKQVTVNKLKKAYSVLGQVAQRAIADNGAISVTNGEPLNSNTCKSIFHTYWLPYFKGAEVYPEGKKPNLNDNTAFYRHLRSGYWDTNIYTQYAAGRIFFTTPDDMSFYIDIMKWVSKYDNDGKLISQTGVYNSFQTVYVDINGLKQPNTIGKDVFIFTIDFEKGIAKPWGYNSSDSAINSTDVYYAAKIIKDGWKITYPW